ncbi:unnamed protein product [Amoebophrya sp. A25]|nr:unnamed protein product [Amoebophrya sp. A25]|eukprot:GSA25T00019191001.1
MMCVFRSRCALRDYHYEVDQASLSTSARMIEHAGHFCTCFLTYLSHLWGCVSILKSTLLFFCEDEKPDRKRTSENTQLKARTCSPRAKKLFASSGAIKRYNTLTSSKPESTSRRARRCLQLHVLFRALLLVDAISFRGWVNPMRYHSLNHEGHQVLSLFHNLDDGESVQSVQKAITLHYETEDLWRERQRDNRAKYMSGVSDCNMTLSTTDYLPHLKLLEARGAKLTRTFVNIGAQDGVTEDPVYAFVHEYGARGLYFEQDPEMCRIADRNLNGKNNGNKSRESKTRRKRRDNNEIDAMLADDEDEMKENGAEEGNHNQHGSSTTTGGGRKASEQGSTINHSSSSGTRTSTPSSNNKQIIVCAGVSPNNIVGLLDRYGSELLREQGAALSDVEQDEHEGGGQGHLRHFDLIKIDIDSFDAPVLEEILSAGYSAKHFIIEINPAIPPPFRFATHYHPKLFPAMINASMHDWPLRGMSLSYAVARMRKAGYLFVTFGYHDAYFVHRKYASAYNFRAPYDEYDCYHGGFIMSNGVPIEKTREWFYRSSRERAQSEIFTHMVSHSLKNTQGKYAFPFFLSYGMEDQN